MTVSTTENTKYSIGNGVTTNIPFSFQILDAAHLEVYLDNVEQTSGFTVNINTDQATSPGGSVDFIVAPVDQVQIALIRNVPLSQLIDYSLYDSFPSETHERGLDKLTQIVQQLNTDTSRLFGFSQSVSDAGSTKVQASAADRAFKLLSFNSNGDLIDTQEIGVYTGAHQVNYPYSERDLWQAANDNVYIVITAHVSVDEADSISNSSLIVDATAAAESADEAAASVKSVSNKPSYTRNTVTNQVAVTQGQSTRSGMSSTIYVGNDTNQSIVTNVDMATGDFGGLVWVKNRDTTNNNVLTDSVRGLFTLTSNNTAIDVAGTTRITALNSDGFDVGNSNTVNELNENYASWSWQTTERISGLTNRNKPYTCHYNAQLGFSIVGYEGDKTLGYEIPHYLTKAPELSIYKNRDSASKNWLVKSSLFNEDDTLYLNDTTALTTASATKAIPTEDVITIGSSDNFNADGANIISYHFHSVEGVCKIGNYIGTGADGNYVECGFKAGWVMIKNLTTDNTDWRIFDISRDGASLFPSSSDAEGSNTQIEFVDDGFVMTATTLEANNLNDLYVFMAYAISQDDGASYRADYEYPTDPDTVTIEEGTQISSANGFDLNGPIDLLEVVPAGVTHTLGAGFEEQTLWLYKDFNDVYGTTPYRPLEGLSRNTADEWGEQSPLDPSLRTTAAHFSYESSTGVVIDSGNLGSGYEGFQAFDKDANNIFGLAGDRGQWLIETTTTSWVQWKGTEKRVLKSWRMRSNEASRDPRRFTIEGSNDGLNWTVVDGSYATTDYVGNGTLLWGDLQDTSGNTTPYLYHRINITANNGDALYTAIAELEFNTVLPSDYYNVTDGVMYEYRGENLVTNGTDPINFAGWSLSDDAPVITGSDFDITKLGAGNVYISQGIPTVIGETYEVRFNKKSAPAPATNMRYKVGDTENSSTVLFTTNVGEKETGYIAFRFVAEDAVSWITFLCNSSAGDPSLLNNITTKRVDVPIQRVYLAKIITDTNGGIASIENLPISKAKLQDTEVFGDLKVRGRIESQQTATLWASFDGTQSPPLLLTSEGGVSDVIKVDTGNYRLVIDEDLTEPYVGFVTTTGEVISQLNIQGDDKFPKNIIPIRIDDDAGASTDRILINIVIFGGKS